MPMQVKHLDAVDHFEPQFIHVPEDNVAKNRVSRPLTDVVELYSSLSDEYPEVVEMVEINSLAPVTEASCERLFSFVTNSYSKHQTRTLQDTILAAASTWANQDGRNQN
jgi:hypothetical protein